MSSVEPQDMRNVPVTVVIPCYNSVQTIERALESVWNQSCRPVEVIVVDDASVDNTPAVLIRLASHYGSWLEVICLATNSGPATARNAGWERASQTYIAFLDADDSWHPHKIELQYHWMESHPDVRLTAHSYKVYDEVGYNSHNSNGHVEAVPISFHRLLLSNLFSTPTVMLRRDIACRFATGKRYAEDYLLWLMISADYECVFFRQQLTDLHKPAYGASGLSADMWAMEKGELDTFTRLYQLGRLALPMLIALYLLSLLKYLVRLCSTGLRRTAT